MILPATVPDGASVSQHYDELDLFYREMWGEHVHHGLWVTGRETTEEAVCQLVDFVAGQARIREGDRVCDVGSGYGATARHVARTYKARVTALTISQAQYDYAEAGTVGSNPQYRLGDWMDNTFPDEAFDVVLAIESTEHMPDKRRFFSEAARVLRPGGRLVVCAWLADEYPHTWAQRHLLVPICEEGRLAGMGSETEYRHWATQAGLGLEEFYDLAWHVRRTWLVCIKRLAAGLMTDRRYWSYLLDGRKTDRRFVLTLLRIWSAYWIGAMRYGVFTACKPAGPA